MPRRNEALAKQIGQRIATRRKELGWTQEEAAEKAGLSQQFFACAERGIKGKSAESILKVCTALNVSADYLLTGILTKEESDSFLHLLDLMNEKRRHAAKEILKNLLTACGYEIPEQ